MADSINYDDDVQVDKDSLHTELEVTPSRIAKWRREYGKAKAAMDMMLEKNSILKAEAKAVLDNRLAEVESYIRENWDSEEDGKLTEKALAAKVATSKEREGAWTEYVDTLKELADAWGKAVEDKEVLYGACRAMESREAVLKELVSLYLNGYYGSKPNVPQALEDQVNRGTSREIKKKLRRTKQ